MWKRLSYILIVSCVEVPPTQLHCEHPKDFSGFPEHSTHLSTWHSKGWPPHGNVRLRKYKYNQSSAEIKQQVWFESKDYRIYISSHSDFSVWYCLKLVKIKYRMGGGSEGGGRGHMYACGWLRLMCGRNQHNPVKQLSLN